MGDHKRIASFDWNAAAEELDSLGYAKLEGLLPPETCDALSSLYGDPERFRSRVVLARHNFGQGEYQYFANPLPKTVRALRTQLYPPLARIANRWRNALGVERPYPEKHRDFLARCDAAGQSKPTPLLLQYGAGDYNCLHRDLYGDLAFPLQVAVLLSCPDKDFTGGEFILTEQRPRMQSRAEVVPLRQGDGVVFPVSERPVRGKSGRTYRATLRHGVSRIHSGRRRVLGIIFHDAR